MTKTAVMIFLLWLIIWSISTFFLSLRFFSNFSFQNLVLPSVENINFLSWDNLKIRDQIFSEYKKQKSQVSSDIYNQLKSSVMKNFNDFIFGV